MNRKQNLEVFAKTPVRKAVLLQIVPAVASQMVTLVYNLADTYFVGMLNAPHETAAVTVAYPSLYYRVVVIRAPLQGLCYTVRDAVDWCVPPTTRWFQKGSNHSPLHFC